MRRFEHVVSALKRSGRNFVCIYPNNDKGSDIILESLLPLERRKNFKLFPSLRFEYFLTLLKNSDCIIGNSSAGIREAPVFGIPTVNIGSRQKNRYDYESIMNVAENEDKILKALNSLPATKEPSLYFGKGNSAELFIEKLKLSGFWKISCQKQFKDIKIDSGEHA
jgi:UDP-N-acetylglucosamine 2-epimerase (hydrolysing)